MVKCLISKKNKIYIYIISDTEHYYYVGVDAKKKKKNTYINYILINSIQLHDWA